MRTGPGLGVTVAAFRARLRARAHRPRALLVANAAADAITRFSGSMTFVAVHVLWFAAWIVGNLAFAHPFDPFPFGLLTLIVSLEAIFLSAFVLISQNREARSTESRARQDFQTNVYAEVLAELIAAHLGVDESVVESRYRDRLRAAGYADAPALRDADAPA